MPGVLRCTVKTGLHLAVQTQMMTAQSCCRLEAQLQSSAQRSAVLGMVPEQLRGLVQQQLAQLKGQEQG
jgi:hypothetical protein